MAKNNIILIGASAGGIAALAELFRRIKPDIHAAIFVVVHLPQNFKSFLPAVLSRAGGLLVVHAQDGAAIEPGRAFIAPPGRHLLLRDGTMHLVFGPKENGFRPAVDPLFRSAALLKEARLIGVILSGNLEDGSRGLLAIQRAGGATIVQDPAEAPFPSMPANAMQTVQVDHVLPVAAIADLLNKLTETRISEKGENTVNAPANGNPDDETDRIKKDVELHQTSSSPTERSTLTCPDCGGVLWELRDGGLVRYRCHIGHVYSPETLFTSQDDELEKAFWTAIRVLVEKAVLANRLAAQAKANGNAELEEAYLNQADQAEKSAAVIRRSWLNGQAESSKDISSAELANVEITRSEENDRASQS